MVERWELLGDVRVELHGRPVAVKGARPRAVLVLLMLRAGEIVPFEQIIDDLWPDDPPATARNSLQRFVADVRAALGPDRSRLVTVSDGYRLEVDEVDLLRIRADWRDLSERTDLDPPTRFERMRTLIDRAAPELAPGIELASLAGARQRKRAIRLDAVRRACDVAVDHALPVAAVLERWHVEEPLDEHLAAATMRVVAGAGRQADALAIGRAVRERLLDELGVDPSEEFAAAELAVLQQDLPRSPVSAASAAPAVEETAAPSTPRASGLVGRDELLAELGEQLGTARLVTLAGPGGAGKTALATAHVAMSAPSAAVVLLADLTTERVMLESVAAAVGLVVDIDDLPTLRTELARRLAGRSGVTVLDNAEHLADPVADLVAAVLATPGPGRLIVTSREQLRLAGEQILHVAPLALPEAGQPSGESPAVRLFARRGAGVSGQSEEHLIEDPHVPAICRAVDGLPLGLELAAARLSTLSPAELAARMEAPLAGTGARRGSDRQRSLTALLDWSWDLLDEDEQRLLGMLSQFRGWSMSAVEAVGPVGGVELLESLVSKSLVQRAATDGPARFQMLEVVRAYCEQKIGKLLVHQARRSQAFWMLERARRWTEAESLSSADAHDDLATDLPNLLFALDWFEEHGCRRDLLDLVARAGGVFMHRGPVMEGAARARATEALMATACPVHDVVHDDPVGRDRRGFFLASFAGMSLSAGDTSTSFRVRIGASELVGAEPYDWAVDALGILGVGYEMGRPDGAGLSLIERAAALAPATRSADLNTALASTCLAQSFLMRRRYRDAAPAFARAAAAERARGRVLLQAETGRLGALHLLGDHDGAASLAASTRSKVGTDSWHYLIDVLRAIALAPGDPVLAADVLDTVLGVHPGDELPGRTGDIAVASGVLARLAGRDETGFELLRSGMGRLPIISALQAEYLLDEPRRPMADDAWSDHWEATVVAAYQAQLEQPDGWVQEQILPGRVRSQLEQLRLDDDRETETT